MKLVKNEKKYWEFIRQLRFHPENLEGFIQKKIITKKQQSEYMKKYNDDYYICLIENIPVGFIGIVDKDLRLAVHPDYKKKGVGLFMLKGVKNISHTAKILLGNKASLNLFLKCNYIKVKQDENFYYLIP